MPEPGVAAGKGKARGRGRLWGWQMGRHRGRRRGSSLSNVTFFILSLSNDTGS
jgi:hypothetical protein